MNDDGFELIYSYSRKQAIEDGVLIDVSEQARASGFTVPVCVGDNLYHGYVVPPEGLEGEGQSPEGRLHDLFEMTKIAARSSGESDRVYFEVLFLTSPGHLEKVRCVAVVGPGDNLEPVMTICLPMDL
jgi:hypothetical protein